MRRKKHYGDQQLASLKKTLSVRLKVLREEAEMSQSQLARTTKVSLSTLNEIENQVMTDVRLSTVSALAAGLGKNPLELLAKVELGLSNSEKRELEDALDVLSKFAKKIQ